VAFNPKYTITDSISWSFTQIERARGFLEAAQLSENWLQRMQRQAFVREAHHTTHIEGTQLTLTEAEQLLDGAELKNIEPDDAKELLNYR
jgi:hypothetical protein